MKIFLRTITLLSLFSLVQGNAFSQTIIDQVIAVVGDEPILESDIETQAMQVKSQEYFPSGDVNCNVLEEMLFQKLLIRQAEKDSLQVTSAEVDNELDRRLKYFISQLGSEKKLEEYYEKTIPEIKKDMRDMIKEQIISQRMQTQLTSDIDITPTEVRNHFNNIPEDSLPVIPTTYKIKQITKYPGISEEEEKRCLDKIKNLRERILDGENFSTLAVLYSDDPGSARKGGELGFVGRTDLVPEFASVAFNMKPEDTVSRIIETEFGYHILKLIEKKGNMVNVRHILITPRSGKVEAEKTRKKLNDIRSAIIKDSISFEKAAEKYSDDENTKNNGGLISNLETGKTTLTKSELDPMAQGVIVDLEEGELSRVIKTRDERGKPVLKFFKLEKKTPEHKANLKDDYQKYYDEALKKKEQKAIKEWINNQLKETYVRIDPSYQNCEFSYSNWNISK